jgi:hypothetical protein
MDSRRSAARFGDWGHELIEVVVTQCVRAARTDETTVEIPKGVVLSQVLLSRKREFLQIVQMFEIRRAHACCVKLLAISRDVFINIL